MHKIKLLDIAYNRRRRSVVSLPLHACSSDSLVMDNTLTLSFHQRNLQKILGITWKDHMTNMEVLSRTGQRRLQDIVAENYNFKWQAISSGCHLDDQPITPCHGPLVIVQRRLGGLHLKKTWWTEESIGTASGLWLQTEADGELLLPIVLSRTGGSKSK